MADKKTAPAEYDDICAICGANVRTTYLARTWRPAACEDGFCTFRQFGHAGGMIKIELIARVVSPSNGRLCAHCAADMLNAEEEDMQALEEDRHGS